MRKKVIKTLALLLMLTPGLLSAQENPLQGSYELMGKLAIATSHSSAAFIDEQFFHLSDKLRVIDVNAGQLVERTRLQTGQIVGYEVKTSPGAQGERITRIWILEEAPNPSRPESGRR